MHKTNFWLFFVVAILAGLLIGWADTRPTWDDAGITAGSILVVTALLGAMVPGRAWVWALAVGGMITGLSLMLGGGFGAAVSLPIGFAGSYAGAFVRSVTKG